MSELKYFLSSNKKQRETVQYAATSTLCDDKGEPLKWTIKTLTTAENDKIRDDCMREVKVPGKPNMYRMRLDTSEYISKMLAASVVEPDLFDRTLQDSYGVGTPEDLLKAMIDIPAEYDNFMAFIQNLNGFDVTLDDKVEEAKN